MPFPRLPEHPSFPVYGLGDQFDGVRRLAMWNLRGWLYTVTLGHGSPEDGPWVSVQTERKMLSGWVGGTASSGATGLNTVIFGALIRLVEMRVPKRREQAKLMEAELDFETDFSEGYSLASLGPNWEEDELTVDGVARPAFSRRTPEAWATIADLDTVAVAVNGPASMASLGARIVDVRPTLDTYN